MDINRAMAKRQAEIIASTTQPHHRNSKLQATTAKEHNPNEALEQNLFPTSRQKVVATKYGAADTSSTNKRVYLDPRPLDFSWEGEIQTKPNENEKTGATAAAVACVDGIVNLNLTSAAAEKEQHQLFVPHTGALQASGKVDAISSSSSSSSIDKTTSQTGRSASYSRAGHKEQGATYEGNIGIDSVWDEQKEHIVNVESSQYAEILSKQPLIRDDKLLLSNRWKHPTDTQWHILRIKNKDELASIREVLEKMRQNETEEQNQSSNKNKNNLASLSGSSDIDEVQVFKFLTLRYEEPQDQKIFKDVEKCEAIDARNASRYVINSKLMDIVGSHILLPLYQKPQKVPMPLEYAPIARERWAAYCASPAVQLKQVVRYLYKRGKLAQRDYKINKSVETANEIAFEEAIEREIARYKSKEPDGLVPVRIKGQRPARWNGRDPTDSRGVYIRWVRKSGFSFLRNDLIDIEHYKPDVKVMAKEKVIIED